MYVAHWSKIENTKCIQGTVKLIVKTNRIPLKSNLFLEAI